MFWLRFLVESDDCSASKNRPTSPILDRFLKDTAATQQAAFTPTSGIAALDVL